MGPKNPGQIGKDPGFGQDLASDQDRSDIISWPNPGSFQIWPDLLEFGQDFWDFSCYRSCDCGWLVWWVIELTDFWMDGAELAERSETESIQKSVNSITHHLSQPQSRTGSTKNPRNPGQIPKDSGQIWKDPGGARTNTKDNLISQNLALLIVFGWGSSTVWIGSECFHVRNTNYLNRSQGIWTKSLYFTFFTWYTTR